MSQVIEIVTFLAHVSRAYPDIVFSQKDIQVYHFLHNLVFVVFIKPLSFDILQDNLQILRDLSLLQIQMRDLEGYKVGII